MRLQQNWVFTLLAAGTITSFVQGSIHFADPDAVYFLLFSFRDESIYRTCELNELPTLSLFPFYSRLTIPEHENSFPVILRFIQLSHNIQADVKLECSPSKSAIQSRCLQGIQMSINRVMNASRNNSKKSIIQVYLPPSPQPFSWSGNLENVSLSANLTHLFPQYPVQFSGIMKAFRMMKTVEVFNEKIQPNFANILTDRAQLIDCYGRLVEGSVKQYDSGIEQPQQNTSESYQSRFDADGVIVGLVCVAGVITIVIFITSAVKIKRRKKRKVRRKTSHRRRPRPVPAVSSQSRLIFNQQGPTSPSPLLPTTFNFPEVVREPRRPRVTSRERRPVPNYQPLQQLPPERRVTWATQLTEERRISVSIESNSSSSYGYYDYQYNTIPLENITERPRAMFQISETDCDGSQRTSPTPVVENPISTSQRDIDGDDENMAGISTPDGDNFSWTEFRNASIVSASSSEATSVNDNIQPPAYDEIMEQHFENGNEF